jgi:hypothetical protein
MSYPISLEGVAIPVIKCMRHVYDWGAYVKIQHFEQHY